MKQQSNTESATPSKGKVITMPLMELLPQGEVGICKVTFHPRNMLALYREGKSELLNREFIRIIRGIFREQITALSPQDRGSIELYLNLLFGAFCDPKYIIVEKEALSFIEGCVTLACLTSVTSYQTTDEVVKVLLKQPGSILKILTLYTHRNLLDVDPEWLYQQHPYYSSVWWTIMVGIGNYDTLAAATYKKVRFFLEDRFIKLFLNPAIFKNRPFYVSNKFLLQANYIDETKEREIKERTRTILGNQKVYSRTNFSSSTPDFKKILFISPHLFMKHVVYKCLAPMYYSLKGSYTLSLLMLQGGPGIEEYIDRNLFDEVFFASDSEEAKIPTETLLNDILKRNFGIVLFPDIGITVQSVILSNYRFAPIQVTCYGHPVSSYSPMIDYMIGSQPLERAEKVKNIYSERVILMPGPGGVSIKPDYALKRYALPKDKIIISCNWGLTKTQYPHLLNLKKILEKSSKKVIFYFLGIEDRGFVGIPATRDIIKIIPRENMATIPQLKYEGYMRILEECHFGIDSFPYGGYNRIIDTLWCRKPIVILEGDRAYNIAGAYLLRQIGLGKELVATSDEEFVEKTVRLIEDDAFREEVTTRIEEADFDATLFDTGDAKYFKKAFDYIVEHHEEMQQDKSHDPVFIAKE